MQRRRFLASLAIGGGAGCFRMGDSSLPTHTESPVTPTKTGDTSTAVSHDTESASPTDTPRENPASVFVGPDGSDTNSGHRNEPLATIQESINRAESGETIQVLPGEYRELVTTRRSGETGNPITITGPPNAYLRSPDEVGHLLWIRHSHVHLRGLTIDGTIDPDHPDQASSYQLETLVESKPRLDSNEYLTDLVIAPHGIGNGQGPLISPNRTTNSEVGPFRVIGPAGLEWKLTNKTGHVGEIVYLGTDPTNLGTDWHPWTENDKTSDIRVHRIDNSEGHPHSRLVQTKPGVHDVLIEYCTDGGGTEIWRDGTSSSVFFECHRATLRWCVLENGDGTGVTIGSPWASQEDATAAERKSGSMNSVYGNKIVGFADKAVRFPHGQGQADQEHICGNEYEDPTDGNPGRPCPYGVPQGGSIGHTGGDSP